MKKFISALMVFAFLISTLGINLTTVQAASTSVGSFESGTDNWQWGANVTALSHVTTSLNAPGTPYNGSRMGEISTSAVAGTTWRSIYKNFSTPLNLTSTPYFSGAFNTYGIDATHKNFEVKLTFFSNSQSYSVTKSISSDKWNEVAVDLSGWAYKSSLTRMEIAFRSVTYTPGWLAKHQVDDLKFSSDDPNADYIGTINSLSANASQIAIAGSCNTAASLQLALIGLKEYETYSSSGSYTALATQTVTPSSGVASFSFSIPRISGNVDRAYWKYAVINNSTKQLIDSVKYVSDIQSSVNSYEFPQSSTIKGLQVQLIDDAQKVGIGHAALNVAFDQMFLPSTSSSAKIAFSMDGETFYFRKSYIDSLDLQTKTLSDNNVVVTFILIMYDLAHCGNQAAWNESAAINNALLHPNYSGNGTVAAFNITDANGTKYYKAAMEFLASRYTRSDEAYGRAVNYIVGNEVNSQYYWYDMGNKALDQFVEEYSRALRIANTAVKKYYNNGRAYISLDHFWNGAVLADGMKAYKGKELVDELNRRVKLEGNIPWNIAYHPYPEDLFDPKVWEDTTATNSYNTVRITFKNLNILSDYIKQANYLYNGQMRRIILSEQGFHSLSNSLADQKIQAAAYAYAYYKAKFTAGIDSFILHRHVDHGGEGGLNLGFWTRDTSKSVPYAPGQKKYLYDVFQKIDTSESVSVTDFAKSIIGISNWTDVIPGYDASKLADRTPPAAGSLVKQAISPTANITDFETGAEGWTKSEYAQGMATVASFTNAPGTPYSGSKLMEVDIADNSTANAEGYGGARAEHGITKKYAAPIDATANPKLQFAIDSYGGCPNATKYYVTVRVYSGKNIIEGKAQMTPDSWNTYSMDLSGWAYKASIDKVKIWFSTDSTFVWNAKFQIDKFGFQ